LVASGGEGEIEAAAMVVHATAAGVTENVGVYSCATGGGAAVGTVSDNGGGRKV